MGQTFSLQKQPPKTLNFNLKNGRQIGNESQNSALKAAKNGKTNKFRAFVLQESIHPKCQISRQSYHDIEALTNMYTKFTNGPFQYVCTILFEDKRSSQTSFTTETQSLSSSLSKYEKMENQSSFCRTQNLCSSSLIIHTKKAQMTLDNLLVIKRKSKKPFTQSQIWYALKYISEVFCFMQNNDLAYGSISPNNFMLDCNGKQLRINVRDLRPENEHFFQYKLTNYYSPEFINSLRKTDKQTIQNINKFKCQVFAIGLMILEMAIIPQHKPKFFVSLGRQFNYSVIASILESTKVKYSQSLHLILSKMLCLDVRSRPDWIFMKQWVFRHQDRRYEVAPCFY